MAKFHKNEKLAKEYQQGSVEALDELVVINRGLVWDLAHMYKARSRSLTVEDLAQEGFMGLIRAAQLYDPDKGAKFSTYASYHIKAKIRRALELDNLICLPHHVVEKMRYLLKLREELTSELGRIPTFSETKDYLEEPSSNDLNIHALTHLLSLDEPISAGDEKSSKLSDLVGDEDALKGFSDIESMITVDTILSRAGLSDSERELLTLLYGLAPDTGPLSLREVSERLGCHHNTVQQRKKSIAKKIRKVRIARP